MRLLVARRSDGGLSHGHFTDLPRLLEAGDVLVVNTSATLPASLEGRAAEAAGRPSTSPGRLPGGLWMVELRHRSPPPARPWASGRRQRPWLDAAPGTVVRAAGRRPGRAARARLGRRWPPAGRSGSGWRPSTSPSRSSPTWPATAGPSATPTSPQAWPISSYQTVFAEVPGSAEMPSAARPFSAEVITRLVSRGVGIAPFVLHCGVSSPETPRAAGRRVVPGASDHGRPDQRGPPDAVAGSSRSGPRPSEPSRRSPTRRGRPSRRGLDRAGGHPDRPIRSVDGLITGWHEPGASHLALLEAVAGPDLVAASYAEALAERYLWHEFGDSHLVLP